MMRSTPIKQDKKTIRASLRKPAVLRKKKMIDAKPLIRDTVSETISFVIKGKLTPIKLIETKLDLSGKGKQPRRSAKITQQTTKKSINVMTKDTKVQKKTAKKTSALSRKSTEKTSIKESSTPTKTSKVEPKSTVMKLKKAEEIVMRKSRKTPTPRARQIKKGKEEKKLTDIEKEQDEIKKQQTIEQLLKQVNEEMSAKNTPKGAKRKNKKQSQTDKFQAHEQTAVKVKAEDDEQDTCLQRAIKCELPESPGALSDEIPLKELSTIKTEPLSDKEATTPRATKKKQFRKLKTKPKMTIIKKRVTAKKDDQKYRTKLFGFWNGPKRHRVASLNARAKVHCLYENETRGNILDNIEESDGKLPYAPSPKKDNARGKQPRVKEELDSEDEEPPSPPPTRTLRSLPGLRGAGKHWEMLEDSYSSEDEYVRPTKIKREAAARPKKERAKKNELVMDLKDMVVRKRMASLNATAILAASYSAERRSGKHSMEDDDSSCASSEEYFAASDNDVREEAVKREEEDGMRAGSSKKVAVIVNQDTDVTITGVYVNSTTRSTHHEGYCSIAGMQYRISATSHTQTAATAVATETLLQTAAAGSAPDNSNSDSMPSSKSYTPLDALSNMQPPPGPGIQQHHPVLHGQQHMGPPGHVLPMTGHPISPGLRHSCSSAFSSPHSTPNYQIPPGHHPPMQGEAGFIQGE